MDLESRILVGGAVDWMERMPNGSVSCIVTSPPYWALRDYGHPDQIGQERTVTEYVAALVNVFRQARRILAPRGTLWLNLGDLYAIGQLKDVGVPNKGLVGLPWRVAIALQEDGWVLRSDIVWSKTRYLPSSIKDRPTLTHEHVFLLSKRGQYHFDGEQLKVGAARSWTTEGFGGKRVHRFQDVGIRSAGRFGVLEDRTDDDTRTTKWPTTVWEHPCGQHSDAHFAVMDLGLATKCIRGGCPKGGLVFDPFFGAGTTALAAEAVGRAWAGTEINEGYAELAQRRIRDAYPLTASPILERLSGTNLDDGGHPPNG